MTPVGLRGTGESERWSQPPCTDRVPGATDAVSFRCNGLEVAHGLVQRPRPGPPAFVLLTTTSALTSTGRGRRAEHCPSGPTHRLRHHRMPRPPPRATWITGRFAFPRGVCGAPAAAGRTPVNRDLFPLPPFRCCPQAQSLMGNANTPPPPHPHPHPHINKTSRMNCDPLPLRTALHRVGVRVRTTLLPTTSPPMRCPPTVSGYSPPPPSPLERCWGRRDDEGSVPFPPTIAIRLGPLCWCPLSETFLLHVYAHARGRRRQGKCGARSVAVDAGTKPGHCRRPFLDVHKSFSW